VSKHDSQGIGLGYGV